MSVGKLGRFELLAEVGKSDDAVVYKATDTGSNRTVCLKVFQLAVPGIPKEAVLARLVEEAESTRELSHQNIVLLYGAGEIDGKFCAAMEYIEGLSVAATLQKKEGFSIWDMLDISRQVCNGLDCAHNLSLIHQRMQPANVFVQWDGTVKILGYGVSGMWSLADCEEISPALYYSAPEQVRGEALDARSNWYSWGAILYEMATGQRPFDGATADEIRDKILVERPIPPMQLNPKVQQSLNQVILKALSKSAEERYQSGREFLDALEKCKEEPKAAAPASKTTAPKMPAPVSRSTTSRSADPLMGDPVMGKPEVRAAVKAPSVAPSTNAVARQIAPAPGKASAAAASASSPAVPSPAAPSSAAPSSVAPWGAQNQTPASAQSAAGSSPKASIVVEEGTAEVPAPEVSRFAVDPTMAGDRTSGPGSAIRSFSEIDELPPLKETYHAPAKAAPVAPPEEAGLEAQVPLVSPFAPKAEEKASKFKLPPMPKVDPKLLFYGIGGAVAAVLLMYGIISLYVHFHTTDDEGTSASHSAPAPEETAASVAPAPEPASTRTEESPTPSNAGRAASHATKPAHKPVAVPVAATVPGQLAVNSVPEGAQLQIDGHSDPAWVTPFTLAGLTAGPHTIMIGKAGFAAETRAVDIASASKSFLMVHLNSLAAILAVSSEPSGASIIVDGRDTGKFTPSQISVDHGSHNILVRKSGYLEESATASVESGQSFRFAPNLRALGAAEDIKTVGKFGKLFGGGSQAGMTKVSIRTNPKGAQVAVNQRLLDRLSPVDFMVNPGTYVIDITASGYKPVHKIVTADRGGKLNLDETLESQ